jgi:prepilin-type N-terminal cleavage/methylation domain-containing protein
MDTRGSKRNGFSLPEMLVVLAILGLAIAVGIPLVSEQVRLAKIRGAADQFSGDIRAARMIAVSKRATVNLVVYPNPTNRYEIPRTDGTLRSMQLPSGVRITSPVATMTIAFLANGAASETTTVFEADVSGGVKERWTVTTSMMGVPTTTHQRL